MKGVVAKGMRYRGFSRDDIKVEDLPTGRRVVMKSEGRVVEVDEYPPSGDPGPPVTHFFDLLIWWRMQALSRRILPAKTGPDARHP